VKFAPALVAVLSLAVASVPATAQAEDGAAAAEKREVVDLDSLLRGCAKMPGMTARFAEAKQIALLSVPLHSAGTVYFARGRGLVRHTTEPAKQSVLVTDKEVVLWDGKATRRMNLASSSAVETFARAFALILAADRPALEKRFDLRFRTGEAGAWSLALTPKAAELARVISSIELEGRGLVLSVLRVREANGDLSTTRFTDVDVAKRWSDDDADQAFRIPPS
jgi:outer membrane lipoprotein-sorting protein